MGDNLRYGKTQEQSTQELIERITILEEKLKESEEREKLLQEKLDALKGVGGDSRTSTDANKGEI